MKPLPKFVRQHLQATAQAGVHPDPDLLAAFVESSLNERERIPVLEHLANCADCRQIIAFSLPPLEQPPAAVAWPSRPSSWHRTGLRWAAVAACVAAVGGGVILRRHALATKEGLVARKPTQSMPNEYSSQTQVSKQADQMVARAEAPQPRRGSVLGKASPGKPRQLDKLQKQTATDGGSGFGAATSESQGRESGAPLAFIAKAAPGQAGKKLPAAGRQEQGLETRQVQLPAASETVQVESAAPAVSIEPARVYPGTEAKDFAFPAPPPEPVPPNGGRPPRGTVGGSMISRNEAVQSENAGHSIMPRWTLSSDGTLLLRSFDNGRTWQSIRVASKMVFRALSARDREVWIGGSAGALYHSSDSGEHWQKVEPAAGARILVADVIALEFTDPQHGKLITANHEIWITADAGQSWQLQ